MATAQDIIDSARYDLIDYVDGVGVGIEFDDVELLNYLNRIVGLMDSQLSALQSDLVEATDFTFTTTANLDYVDISTLNSGLWTRVRSLYSDTSFKLEQVSLNYMRYTRQYRRQLISSGESVTVGAHYLTISQSTTDLTGLGAGDNNAGTYWTCSTAGTMGSGDALWQLNSGRPTIFALYNNQILFPQAVGSVYNLTINYDQKSATLSLISDMPYGDRFNEFFREMLVMNARARGHGGLQQGGAIMNGLFKTRAMQEEIQRGFVPRPYPYWEM